MLIIMGRNRFCRLKKKTLTFQGTYGDCFAEKWQTRDITFFRNESEQNY